MGWVYWQWQSETSGKSKCLEILNVLTECLTLGHNKLSQSCQGKQWSYLNMVVSTIHAISTVSYKITARLIMVNNHLHEFSGEPPHVFAKLPVQLSLCKWTDLYKNHITWKSFCRTPLFSLRRLSLHCLQAGKQHLLVNFLFVCWPRQLLLLQPKPLLHETLQRQILVRGSVKDHLAALNRMLVPLKWPINPTVLYMVTLMFFIYLSNKNYINQTTE